MPTCLGIISATGLSPTLSWSRENRGQDWETAITPSHKQLQCTDGLDSGGAAWGGPGKGEEQARYLRQGATPSAGWEVRERKERRNRDRGKPSGWPDTWVKGGTPTSAEPRHLVDGRSAWPRRTPATCLHTEPRAADTTLLQSSRVAGSAGPTVPTQACDPGIHPGVPGRPPSSSPYAASLSRGFTSPRDALHTHAINISSHLHTQKEGYFCSHP